MHAVQARLAVHVFVVVGGPVERLERLAVAVGPVAQEGVEHLLPRLRVDPRRLRKDAVQIEQARRDPRGDRTHDPPLSPPPQMRDRDEGGMLTCRFARAGTRASVHCARFTSQEGRTWRSTTFWTPRWPWPWRPPRSLC